MYSSWFLSHSQFHFLTSLTLGGEKSITTDGCEAAYFYNIVTFKSWE